jgi:hypothetical protein
VLSVPRCYKQDILSNELVVGQSSASNNLRTEAEDIAGPVTSQRLVKRKQAEKT